MKKFTWLIISLMFLMPFSIAKAGETWTIISYDWPPYACQACPEQGAAISALRQALKTQGVDLKVDFDLSNDYLVHAAQAKYVGHYPAWAEDVTTSFTQSEAIFTSALGFLQFKNKPLAWSKFEDLRGKSVGVLQRYKLPAEGAAMAKRGDLKLVTSVDDYTALTKFVVGKIDTAVFEPQFLRWTLKSSFPEWIGVIELNSKIIEERPFFVALNKTSPQVEAKSKIISAGLKKVNAPKLIADYLAKYNK